MSDSGWRVLACLLPIELLFFVAPRSFHGHRARRPAKPVIENLAMLKPSSVDTTRRQFLGTLSAASLGLVLPAQGAPSPERGSSGWKFNHRVQFGAWINDMRNQVLPRDNWPAKTLDEVT